MATKHTNVTGRSASSGETDAASFEEEPDSLEAQIVKLAREGKLAGAARQAILAQEARGIPVTFQRGDEVIKRYADGREEVLGHIERLPDSNPSDVADCDGK